MAAATNRRAYVVTAAVVLLAGVLAVAGPTFWRPDDPRPADSNVSRPAETAPGAPESQPSRASGTPASDLHPFDIATAALGARIESFTSQRDARENSAANLIDGGAGHVLCAPLCAWASEDDSLPQEFILSFYQRRDALVARVVIDTLTPTTREGSFGVPRDVELWASTSSATDGFSRVAAVSLPAASTRHTIDLEPIRLRYLKVRVLSRHGGTHTLIGEVGVFEARDTASILADFPRNLAFPALGGTIASFTSEYGSWIAANLTDGNPETEWRAASEYLPQELVFAFNEDRTAFIDSLAIDVGRRSPAVPKTVAVSVSATSPVAEFEDVGRFTLEDRPGDQIFPIGRHARFLKLRLLESAGGERLRLLVSLAEIGVFEGAPSGYQSVLFRTDGTGDSAPAERPPSIAADAAGDASLEQEPNDTPALAGRLEPGRAVYGAIDPVGEHDYFRVSVPGPDQSVLTVDLEAVPYVRTSIDLIDAAGREVHHYDPARAAGSTLTFSWRVAPGDYALRLADPPASVVLVWDTSGSMKGREQDLQRAVETYLDLVPPEQQVNLIRFSHDVEVLLPGFSNDRSRLKAATAGKFFADGATPLYDAIETAMSLLADRRGNRAIVVMSDGEDAGSRLHRTELWSLLQERKIRLYTIGLGDMDRYDIRLASSPRRLMQQVALATGGRAFFTRESGELTSFYRWIAEELETTCTYRLRVSASRGPGSLRVRAAERSVVAVPARVELILDASGSMKRRVGGRTMIDEAKHALSQIIDGLPDDSHVALRVYGHRIPEGRSGDCEDSQLVYPFAKIDKPALMARIRDIKALGTTPIAYSLGQVAGDMGNQPGEKVIVLVTDGKEECGGDPAAALRALQAAGVNPRLNIVGFALADERLKTELRQLAQMTSGQFLDARDGGTLRGAIERSLGVPYDVLDEAGSRIGGGLTGDTIPLPEGVYTVVVLAGEERIEIPDVRVRSGETATLELRNEGREVVVHKGR